MEHAPAPCGPGAVVLDIGGDVGAAIVYAPPSLAGAELEIRRLGERWAGHYVAVRARHLSAGVMHAALFDRLEHGRYQVRVRSGQAGEALRTFEVVGGRITEVRLAVVPLASGRGEP
jgi:hypothetical protein